MLEAKITQGTDREMKLNFNQSYGLSSNSYSYGESPTSPMTQRMTLQAVKGYTFETLSQQWTATWSDSQTFPITFDMTQAYGAQTIVYHMSENMAPMPYGGSGSPLTYVYTVTPTGVDWLEFMNMSYVVAWDNDQTFPITFEGELTQGTVAEGTDRQLKLSFNETMSSDMAARRSRSRWRSRRCAATIGRRCRTSGRCRGPPAATARSRLSSLSPAGRGLAPPRRALAARSVSIISRRRTHMWG